MLACRNGKAEPQDTSDIPDGERNIRDIANTTVKVQDEKELPLISGGIYHGKKNLADQPQRRTYNLPAYSALERFGCLSKPKTANIPVIFLTGNSDMDRRRYCNLWIVSSSITKDLSGQLAGSNDS
ncbi:MAG: hypothetical protein IJR85_08635 [Synergistaceae bacterium]|nr:hypothetical protein [Synergistaceae bacterium]